MTEYMSFFFCQKKILEYIYIYICIYIYISWSGSSKIKYKDMLIEIQKINEKKIHKNSL